MVTKVISELKSVSRLKIFPETGPRYLPLHALITAKKVKLTGKDHPRDQKMWFLYTAGL